MTRRSEREVERALAKMEDRLGGPSGDVDVVWSGDGEDEYVDVEGEPTEPDPDADLVVVIDETIVATDWERGEA